MESLAEEVAQKQQQVQDLQQEQLALSSRLLALERLLQSGEFHMHFLTQRMGGLTVTGSTAQQPQQQQQQQCQLPWQSSSSSGSVLGTTAAAAKAGSVEVMEGLCRVGSGASCSSSCCVCSGGGTATAATAAAASGLLETDETGAARAVRTAKTADSVGGCDGDSSDDSGERGLRMLLSGGIDGGGALELGKSRGSVLTKQQQQHQKGFGFLREAGWKSSSRSGGYLVPKTAGTAAGDAAAEAAMRMDGCHQSVVEMGTHYKEFLSNVAPLVLAAKSGGQGGLAGRGWLGRGRGV